MLTVTSEEQEKRVFLFKCVLMEVLINTDGFYTYFISERSPLGFGKFLTCSPKTFPSPSLELVQSHKAEKLEKFHNFLTSSNAQHLYQDVWWNLHSLIVKGSCLPVLPQQTEICQLTLLKNMYFFHWKFGILKQSNNIFDFQSFLSFMKWKTQAI